VVGDGLPPELDDTVEAVNVEAVEVEGICMNIHFWALSSRMRCCNR